MNTHPSHHPQRRPVGKHPDYPARPALGQVTRGRTHGQNEEPSDTQAGGFSTLLRTYPVTLAVTSLTALLLSVAACFALYESPDPTALILPCAAATLGLAALAGGITAGRLNPTSPVPAGLVCGVLTAVLLTLLSLVTGGAQGLIPWVMRLGVLLLHAAGSALTRPRKEKSTHTAGKHPSRR